MSNSNNGGPAFSGTRTIPRPYRHDESACNYIDQPYAGNVSLRDYFATRAMQPVGPNRPASLLQWFRWAFGYSYKASGPSTVTNAKLAYAQADEMLKARDL